MNETPHSILLCVILDDGVPCKETADVTFVTTDDEGYTWVLPVCARHFQQLQTNRERKSINTKN